MGTQGDGIRNQYQPNAPQSGQPRYQPNPYQQTTFEQAAADIKTAGHPSTGVLVGLVLGGIAIVVLLIVIVCDMLYICQ